MYDPGKNNMSSNNFVFEIRMIEKKRQYTHISIFLFACSCLHVSFLIKTYYLISQIKQIMSPLFTIPSKLKKLNVINFFKQIAPMLSSAYFRFCINMLSTKGQKNYFSPFTFYGCTVILACSRWPASVCTFPPQYKYIIR